MDFTDEKIINAEGRKGFLELVRKLRKTATYKIHRKRFYVDVLATKSQKRIF